VISWVLSLNKSIWVDWSSVSGISISPDIGFLLSINGSLSGGFGVSVGFVDGIREDTVVVGVTIWDGSGMLLDRDGRGVGDKSHDGETGGRFHF